MKVLIITWLKYKNFGTILQAYALQKKVKLLGYDASTLDDVSVGFDLLESNKALTKKEKILGLFGVIIKYPFNSKKRKEYRKIFEENSKNSDTLDGFDIFRNKYMNIEHNAMDKRYLNNNYQAFICGSDQIWSPLKKVFSKHYYLDFVESRNSKISYAPSMGQNMCSEEMRQHIKPLLKDFEYISVREETGKEMLLTMTDKDINVVLDPTLLLPKDEWDKVTSKRLLKEKYIFCYFLSDNPWYKCYVDKLQKKYNKKVITLTNSNIVIDGTYIDKGVGPSDFLSYIKYADYVITDSFHGTIFSIIFEKQFITLKRFDDLNTDNNQNSRLYNLFKIIDLKNRFIGENNQKDLFDHDINYDIVNSNLTIEINKSENYLRNSLENCKANFIITSNCTGCGACMNVCPVGAIKMVEDKYGETKAEIDPEICINCGLCKKICPNNNSVKFNKIMRCYASAVTDENEVAKSSSAGIAYKISKQVILKGGIVYGCISDNNLNTKHIRVDNLKELDKLQGSKYSQSVIGYSYKEIKKELDTGRLVLFTGVPCQVAGLYAYLRKDYKNLLTIDIACHGVVPTKNIKEYCDNFNKDVNQVTYREKQNYYLSMYVDGEKVYKKDKNKDEYLMAFLNNVSLRENCFSCKYANKNRVGDITLGDFWGLNLKTHSSIILVNTVNGNKTIKELSDVVFEKHPIEKSISKNDALLHPQGKAKERLNFNDGLRNGFVNAIKKSKIRNNLRLEKKPKIIKKIINKIHSTVYRIELDKRKSS